MNPAEELDQARTRAMAAIDGFEAAVRDIASLLASTPEPAIDPYLLAEVRVVNGRAAGLMTAFLRDRPGLLEGPNVIEPTTDPSKEKWRHDVPVGRAVQAAGSLDPAVLRDCRVVLTLSPAGGKLTVIAGEMPTLSLRLAAGPEGERAAAALVLGLIHDYAAACDAAGKEGG